MSMKPECNQPVESGSFPHGMSLKERYLYRTADGDTLPFGKLVWEFLKNVTIPNRKRALMAEGRLRDKNEELKYQLGKLDEEFIETQRQRYGKPNNFGGTNGFIISPVNIKDIEVIWDNEAAVIRFGDRRIAPRLKEWLDNHRNVMPESSKDMDTRPKGHWVGDGKWKLGNGLVVRPCDRVMVWVSDDRGEVMMRIHRIERRASGHLWLVGSVPKGNLPNFTKQAAVHEARVLRYAKAAEDGI